MFEAFYKAVYSAPPKITGIQLREFCAGHLLALEMLESPLFFGSKMEVTPGDIITALYICSRTHEECVAIFAADGKKLQKAMAAFSKLSGKNFDFGVTLGEFCAYTKDAYSIPRLRQIKDDNDIRMPLAFTIIVGSCRSLEGSISLSQAWNMKLSLALCLSATAGALQGGENLLSSREIAASDKIKDGSWRRKKEDKKGKV